MILKILIADDEKPARKKIISFLKDFDKEFQLSEAENGLETIEKIENESPDLVFLDIQMPGLNGFEVIENIGSDRMPSVIFATAYDQYAIEAFKINAVDYLLKPFDKERFVISLTRALDKVNTKQMNINVLENLLKSVRKENRRKDKFLINHRSKYFFVSTSEIIYVSAQEKYVELITDKGKYLLRNTMNNMEEELNNKFVRIHRSYIVNMDYIQEIQPWSHGDYIVILKNGEKLNMSRRYRKNLFDENNLHDIT